MKDRIKYFLYTRKSTDQEDIQVQSIEAQLVELRNYAKDNHLNIIEEFIEKQTAKVPGRPIFKDMLDRMEQGEASGIISWNPDRLSRNSISSGRIIYLIDTGVIKSLKFPTFWFEPTPQGLLMLNMSFGQSKYYVDSLSENTKRGLRQKCRNGWYPGVPPLGYMNDIRSKTIKIDKQVSFCVRRCFEIYSEGNSTYSDTSKYLAEHNLISRTSKHKNSDFVKFMLSNTFYRGIFTYAGETWDGNHELFISQELFDKVQKTILDHSHTFKKKYTLNSQAYCGLLKCGNCGQMITGEHITRKNKNGSIREYTYYHCTKSHKTIKCKELSIVESKLDQQISDLLVEYSLPTNWAEKIIEDANTEFQDELQADCKNRSNVKEQILGINSKLTMLVDMRMDQEIDKNDYLERKRKLIIEKKSLESKINENFDTPKSRIGRIKNWTKKAESLGCIGINGSMREKMIAFRNLSESDGKYGSSLVKLNTPSNPFLAISQKSANPTPADLYKVLPATVTPWTVLVWTMEICGKSADKSEVYRFVERVTGIEPALCNHLETLSRAVGFSNGKNEGKERFNFLIRTLFFKNNTANSSLDFWDDTPTVPSNPCPKGSKRKIKPSKAK